MKYLCTETFPHCGHGMYHEGNVYDLNAEQVKTLEGLSCMKRFSIVAGPSAKEVQAGPDGLPTDRSSLMKIAKELGIKGTNAMKVPDLVAAIAAAKEVQAGPEDDTGDLDEDPETEDAGDVEE